MMRHWLTVIATGTWLAGSAVLVWGASGPRPTGEPPLVASDWATVKVRAVTVAASYAPSPRRLAPAAVASMAAPEPALAVIYAIDPARRPGAVHLLPAPMLKPEH